MIYRFCQRDNFEDFASGRVLYSGKGVPNFPVRLLCELFGRALSCCEKQTGLTVYDPCCGGGYALTVLGFLCGGNIGRIAGSDIDGDMVALAKRNATLLTKEGLSARRREIEELHRLYGKPSHRDALESCGRLDALLMRDIPSEIFAADCTKPLPSLAPDVIFTDVPYGNLVQWGGEENPMEAMLLRLREISRPGAVLCVVMDKKQRAHGAGWETVEKETVGKRRFEILRAV